MTSHFISLHIAPVGHAEGRPPVKRSSRYDERGYAFGQAMLTLRALGAIEEREGLLKA
jgi:hypothetical protein